MFRLWFLWFTLVVYSTVQYDAAAAGAGAGAGAGPGSAEPLPEDPQELRQHLKLADAARRQADEELAYEEVPQPDEDADGM